MRYQGIFRIITVFVCALVIIFSGASSSEASTKEKPDIDHYTCGMHPSVNVSVADFKKGDTLCPICNMKLVSVYKKEAAVSGKDVQEDFIKSVDIQAKEAMLAGIQTEQIKVRHMVKEIRTVGMVAYDPQLAIAQDEFISAVKAMDKIEDVPGSGVFKRSSNLVESSKKKLQLLGLSEKQIDVLKSMKEADSNLVLPGKKMWIYGEVYEYELSWVKQGEEIVVTTTGLPGKEFSGVIASVNPVVDKKTRSITFRAEVNNPGLMLKPDMYVDIVIKSVYVGEDGKDMALAVPKSAVLDTGIRKLVWVDKGDGSYEGHEVELGPEAISTEAGKKQKFYPVFSGLKEGDIVVSKGNFLIDSQSQITGVVSAAYSGALEGKSNAEDKASMESHKH